MTGHLRHGSKHRAKALTLRDRFQYEVVRRFKVSREVISKRSYYDQQRLIVLPRGATCEQFVNHRDLCLEFVVTAPSRAAIIFDPRRVQEVR